MRGADGESYGEELIKDDSVNVEETVIAKCMIEKLCECLPLLSEDELELVTALYFQGKTQSQIQRETGVLQQTNSYRERKILQKLRKILET